MPTIPILRYVCLLRTSYRICVQNSIFAYTYYVSNVNRVYVCELKEASSAPTMATMVARSKMTKGTDDFNSDDT